MKTLLYTSLCFVLMLSSCEKDMGGGSDTNKLVTNNPNTGESGSITRFALAGDNNRFLYIAGHNALTTYDISDANNPILVNTIQQDLSQIETIFTFDNYLLLGAKNGIYVFDIQTNELPSPAGFISHINSCDPVVAENQIAYSTLRANNVCGGTQSVLQVYDIANPNQAVFISELTLQDPYGLGIYNGMLMVCDGKAGIKIFDTSNPGNLIQIGAVNDIDARDIILLKDRFLVMTATGLVQYEYSSATDIVKVSTL